MAKKVTKIADAAKPGATPPKAAPDQANADKLAAFASAAPPSDRDAKGDVKPAEPIPPKPGASPETKGHDAPKKRVLQRAHSLAATEGGDKVENRARVFHEQQDEVADDIARTQSKNPERDAAMNGAVRVPEEDRRRAALSKELGVDLFKRENAGQRPDEPTLLESNQQYFAEEDARRQRKAKLQETVGDTLIEAFGGRAGKRITKNLR